MKSVVATLAVLLGAAGAASAQDGPKQKAEELQRDFERAMKGLQQKFDAERERLEKEFRAARERLLEKRDDRREAPPRRDGEKKPRSTEELLQRVLERLDGLEKKFDRELPRFDFKDMPFRAIPHDFKDLPKFEFKRLEDFRELAPQQWREFLPKFKDEEFRFEFKKKDKKEKRDDEKKDY
jgi:hypothetical protein